jgi:hypothetical protein
MDLTPFVAAFQAHQWALFAALLVGAIVALSKQGWLSTWLAAKIPPAVRPWYALGVSLLTTGSGDLIAGKTWQDALQDVALTFVTAMMGHQIVIESIRHGVELIKRKSSAEGAAPSAVPVVFVFAFAGFLGVHDAACTPAEVQATTAVLTDVQTACVVAALAQSIIPAGTPAATVAADVALGCSLDAKATPLLIAIITAFEAQGVPTPAAAVYTPAPFVAKKKGAPHAALSPLDRPRLPNVAG